MLFCIVDDELDVCDILRLYFESRGHRCVIAHDGESGLELIRSKRPDAIFLDLQMPRKNGYDVLLELRSDEDLKDIPVMMMTGLTKGEGSKDERWAESAAANAFLTKPFELEDLLAAVRKMVGDRM